MHWRRLPWPAFVGCIGAVLLLHAYLGRFAHPMADDFSYALKDVSAGAWKAAEWEYIHWNGRFTSNFLVLFGPLRWDFDALWLYRSVPAALFAVTLLGAFTLLRMVATGLTRSEALMGAVVWEGLYTHLMPDMGEGFYWYTGSVTYQLANALVLFAISAFIHHQRTRSSWSLIVGAVLTVLCIGSNEVMMLLIVSGAALAAGLALRRSAMRPTWWWMIALVFLAAITMIIAPGNAVRGSHFEGTHWLLPSIGMSFLQSVRFSATWLSCGSLMALSVLWWLSHGQLQQKSPALAQALGISPWIWTMALLGVIFLCAFPAYWGTGILGQHRTANVACFLFIPLWFLNLSAWLTHTPQLHSPWRLDLRVVATFLLLCTCDLALTGNSHRALEDLLTGRAARSDVQLQERYHLLEQAARSGQRVAELHYIADPPKSLYVLDLRDPGFLVNQDYAAWFGLDEARPIPDP